MFEPTSSGSRVIQALNNCAPLSTAMPRTISLWPADAQQRDAHFCLSCFLLFLKLSLTLAHTGLGPLWMLWLQAEVTKPGPLTYFFKKVIIYRSTIYISQSSSFSRWNKIPSCQFTSLLSFYNEGKSSLVELKTEKDSCAQFRIKSRGQEVGRQNAPWTRWLLNLDPIPNLGSLGLEQKSLWVENPVRFLFSPPPHMCTQNTLKKILGNLGPWATHSPKDGKKTNLSWHLVSPPVLPY